MRAYEPCSKRRSSVQLEKYFNKEISLKRILFMMDRVSDSEEELKKQIFKTLLAGKKHLKLLLFDVTTLYFESVRADNLRGYGFGKDGKNGEVQIVLAVLSDEDGMPLSYEVFPGNTAETKTFSQVIDSFIKQQSVEKISVVADRGMFSANNLSYLDSLNEEKESTGAEYIVSATLKRLPDEIKKKIWEFKEKAKTDNQIKTQEKNGDISLYSENQFYEFRHKKRRMIISFSEEREVRDRMKREKILEKLSKVTGKEDKIAASNIQINKGIGRYAKKSSSGKNESYVVDRNKIAEDAKWDGIYGLCTNRTEKPQVILTNYRRLWKIEELFRINKHTLSMRPIYHWKPERIYAHIFICFLAYTLLKYTEIELKNVGISYSSETILDALRDVETYIVRDGRKKSATSYGIPRELPKEAEKIYKTLGIRYSKRPYKI